jgi:hypothetical protein
MSNATFRASSAPTVRRNIWRFLTCGRSSAEKPANRPAWSAWWAKGWSSRTQGGLGRIQVVPLDRAAKSEVGGWKFGQILVADYETFSKFLRLYL